MQCVHQIFDTRAVLRGLEALCIRWGTCGAGEGQGGWVHALTYSMHDSGLWEEQWLMIVL